MKRAAPQTAHPSFSCTAGRTTRVATTKSCHRSLPPAAASSCLICAALGETRFLVRDDAALGPAGGAGQRSARIDGCAEHRARRARRLRLGRPRRLRGRRAVAGARARPRHRQRLQHPEHRGVNEAGGAGARSIASGTSIISTANAAAPDWSKTAARCAAISGKSGRRTGRSTTPSSRAAPPRSTIPISSR